MQSKAIYIQSIAYISDENVLKIQGIVINIVIEWYTKNILEGPLMV